MQNSADFSNTFLVKRALAKNYKYKAYISLCRDLLIVIEQIVRAKKLRFNNSVTKYNCIST